MHLCKSICLQTTDHAEFKLLPLNFPLHVLTAPDDTELHWINAEIHKLTGFCYISTLTCLLARRQRANWKVGWVWTCVLSWARTDAVVEHPVWRLTPPLLLHLPHLLHLHNHHPLPHCPPLWYKDVVMTTSFLWWKTYTLKWYTAIEEKMERFQLSSSKSKPPSGSTWLSNKYFLTKCWNMDAPLRRFR